MPDIPKKDASPERAPCTKGRLSNLSDLYRLGVPKGQQALGSEPAQALHRWDGEPFLRNWMGAGPRSMCR